MPKIYCYTNEQKTEKKYFVKCDNNIVTSKDELNAYEGEQKECTTIANILNVINSYNNWKVQP